MSKPARSKWKDSTSTHPGEKLSEVKARLPAGVSLEDLTFHVSYGYYGEMDYEFEWEVLEKEEDYQVRVKKWEEKQAKKAAKK